MFLKFVLVLKAQCMYVCNLVVKVYFKVNPSVIGFM